MSSEQDANDHSLTYSGYTTGYKTAPGSRHDVMSTIAMFGLSALFLPASEELADKGYGTGRDLRQAYEAGMQDAQEGASLDEVWLK